jgi:hypothetical protein
MLSLDLDGDARLKLPSPQKPGFNVLNPRLDVVRENTTIASHTPLQFPMGSFPASAA